MEQDDPLSPRGIVAVLQPEVNAKPAGSAQRGMIPLLRRLLPPLFLVIVVVLLFTASFETHEAIAFLEGFLARYGYSAVFFGCLFESVVGLQWIFPGGLMILFATSQIEPAGVLSLPLTVFYGTAASLMGYSASYWLGRLGLISEGFNERLTKLMQTFRWELLVVLLCVHPNSAAPLMWLLGNSKLRFLPILLLALPAAAFWVTLWALAGRQWGEPFVVWVFDHRKLVSGGLFLCYVLLWLLRHWQERQSLRAPADGR